MLLVRRRKYMSNADRPPPPIVPVLIPAFPRGYGLSGPEVFREVTGAPTLRMFVVRYCPRIAAYTNLKEFGLHPLYYHVLGHWVRQSITTDRVTEILPVPCAPSDGCWAAAANASSRCGSRRRASPCMRAIPDSDWPSHPRLGSLGDNHMFFAQD